MPVKVFLSKSFFRSLGMLDVTFDIHCASMSTFLAVFRLLAQSHGLLVNPFAGT